jgi:hypothetical protein
MSDQSTTSRGGFSGGPANAYAPAAGSGCCGTPATATESVSAAAATPCCGTAEAATSAGTCCDPAAKATAVNAGEGCCG